MRLARLAFLCLSGAVACSDTHRPSPAPRSVTLGGGVVATVGAAPIQSALVARVAAAQKIDLQAALERLVDDAVASEAARARGLDAAPTVAWSLRVAHARFVADRIRDDARAPGPLTDAEVADLTARHWYELDSPEQLRVIHAVVLRMDGSMPADDDRARAVAAEIAARVEDAPTPEEFERRARVVPSGPFTVKVERLPPITADGRVADASGGVMDEDFTRGVFAIGAPGATSDVVRSKFGWHVIRVLERILPRHVPLDERRAELTDEGLTRRAREAFDGTLRRLRASVPVEIASDADALMASIPVDSP